MSKHRKRAPIQGAVVTHGVPGCRGPVVLLFLLTLLVYVPAISGGLIWDDRFFMSRASVSPFVPENRYENRHFVPLLYLSFWLEYQAWGLWPAGYHLINIFLHAGNACLFGRVLQRLAVPGAWLAAFIFALHPVHVESVAWITERKNTLSMFFALSSLLCYLRFAQAPRQRTRDYYAALSLYACALLSKAVTVSLPVVILLIQWWKHGRLTGREIRPLLPMFALGLVVSLLSMGVEGNIVSNESGSQDWSLSFLESVLVAGRALWFYVYTLVWPYPLMFIYPRWNIDPWVWWQWLYPMATLVLTAALYLGRNRIGRGPMVAWLLFAGIMTPALGFVDFLWMRYSFVADHFLYHASPALIALVPALLWRGVPVGQSNATQEKSIVTMLRLVTDSPTRACVSLLLLLTLGSVTWNRAHVYTNEETLWTDTLTKDPSCWIAHHTLGVLFLKKQDYQRALPSLQTATALNPQAAVSLMSLAEVLLVQAQFDEALPLCREAIHLEPWWSQGYLCLALILWEQGDHVQAMYYERMYYERMYYER